MFSFRTNVLLCESWHYVYPVHATFRCDYVSVINLLAGSSLLVLIKLQLSDAFVGGILPELQKSGTSGTDNSCEKTGWTSSFSKSASFLWFAEQIRSSVDGVSVQRSRGTAPWRWLCSARLWNPECLYIQRGMEIRKRRLDEQLSR